MLSSYHRGLSVEGLSQCVGLVTLADIVDIDQPVRGSSHKSVLLRRVEHNLVHEQHC